MPSHDLPLKHPWLLVQVELAGAAGGTDEPTPARGHRLGVTGPARRVFFSFDVAVREMDAAFAGRYRRSTSRKPLHILEFLGFVKEGYHRKESVMDGERENVLAYGILTDE